MVNHPRKERLRGKHHPLPVLLISHRRRHRHVPGLPAGHDARRPARNVARRVRPPAAQGMPPLPGQPARTGRVLSPLPPATVNEHNCRVLTCGLAAAIAVGLGCSPSSKKRRRGAMRRSGVEKASPTPARQREPRGLPRTATSQLRSAMYAARKAYGGSSTTRHSVGLRPTL